MEQATIFGEEFQEFATRSRKELLPGYIKVYTIFLLLFSIILFLGALNILMSPAEAAGTGADARAYAVGRILGILLIVSLVILLWAPVMAQVKWAISAVTTSYFILAGLFLISAILEKSVYFLIPIVVLAPYWLKLFSLRHDWKAAVPHKKKVG